jgi:hypothetical protein
MVVAAFGAAILLPKRAGTDQVERIEIPDSPEGLEDVMPVGV